MITIDVLNMDDIDKSILNCVQKDPNISHAKIAKKINRSQPTVGTRIRKLEELGVLKFQAGINMKTADLILARVDLQTKNPQEIEDLVKKCPYMINAFQLSGILNFNILMFGFKINDIDYIVNKHFRSNPNVKRVSLDIITNVIDDLVLPLNLNFDDCNISDNGHCGHCDEKNKEKLNKINLEH